MGVLRGFGIVIVSVLLFVLLVSAGVFSTLNNSLSYDKVQPKTYSIANEIITTQIGSQNIVNQITPLISIYCINNTEIVQKFNNYTFVFPCEVVSLGYDEIINYSVDYLVKDFYYKNYNCSFTKCFEQSDVPLFLVSDYSKTYWRSLLYKSIIGILILFVILFLLAEKKSNSFIITGSLMIVASLIISQLKNIGSFIAKLVLSPVSTALKGINMNDIITQIVGLFFFESTKVFLWMFVTGIILIGIGILFRLTGWGMKILEKIENMKTKDKVEQLETKTKSLEKQVQQKKGIQNSNQKNTSQNNNLKNNKNMKK